MQYYREPLCHSHWNLVLANTEQPSALVTSGTPSSLQICPERSLIEGQDFLHTLGLEQEGVALTRADLQVRSIVHGDMIAIDIDELEPRMIFNCHVCESQVSDCQDRMQVQLKPTNERQCSDAYYSNTIRSARFDIYNICMTTWFT